MNKTRAQGVIIFILTLALVVSVLSNHKRKPVLDSIVAPPVIIHDTTYVRDTVFVPVPDPVVETVVETIKIPVTETVVVHDTIYLPRTQLRYDSELYRIYVSGHQPSLDSVYVYPKTTVITKTIPAKRWGVGVSVGYGLSGDGFSPYIGAGVYYRLF